MITKLSSILILIWLAPFKLKLKCLRSWHFFKLLFKHILCSNLIEFIDIPTLLSSCFWWATQGHHGPLVRFLKNTLWISSAIRYIGLYQIKYIVSEMFKYVVLYYRFSIQNCKYVVLLDFNLFTNLLHIHFRKFLYGKHTIC
jgi:hypothetical protein